MKTNAPILHSMLLAAALLAAAPAAAHHGAAAFDTSALTRLPAVITALEWRNPHALIRFEAARDDGQVESWTAETAGLVILIRAGWTRDVLRPGDHVVIFGHRAMNGSHTMLLKRLTLPSGQELSSLVPGR